MRNSSLKIKALLEEIRKMEQSKINVNKMNKWKCIPDTARDLQWRGLPRSDSSWKNGNIPVQVEMNFEFWSKYFNFSLKDFYLNGEIFLENFLKITIERVKLFDDDVFISKRVPLWLSTGYEASFFGMNVNFFDDIDPWIDHKPIIDSYQDLDNMAVPSFKTSGLMPKAIEIYEYVKENVDDDFNVIFPEWIRGPFGIATYLRGFDNILIDMLEQPEFVHRLMRFIVESHKQWYKELEKYTGNKMSKINLFNDEVNCPTLSPALYEEFVLPYERELCADYPQGLHYWHSCGDVSNLYKLINQIPQIDMIHRGPWSNSKEVGQVFGKKSVIEVCMHPQRDLYEADFSAMKDNLINIIDSFYETNVKGFTFRANTLGLHKAFDITISKVNDWITAARETGEYTVKLHG